MMLQSTNTWEDTQPQIFQQVFSHSLKYPIEKASKQSRHERPSRIRHLENEVQKSEKISTELSNPVLRAIRAAQSIGYQLQGREDSLELMEKEKLSLQTEETEEDVFLDQLSEDEQEKLKIRGMKRQLPRAWQEEEQQLKAEKQQQEQQRFQRDQQQEEELLKAEKQLQEQRRIQRDKQQEEERLKAEKQLQELQRIQRDQQQEEERLKAEKQLQELQRIQRDQQQLEERLKAEKQLQEQRRIQRGQQQEEERLKAKKQLQEMQRIQRDQQQEEERLKAEKQLQELQRIQRDQQQAKQEQLELQQQQLADQQRVIELQLIQESNILTAQKEQWELQIQSNAEKPILQKDGKINVLQSMQIPKAQPAQVVQPHQVLKQKVAKINELNSQPPQPRPLLLQSKQNQKTEDSYYHGAVPEVVPALLQQTFADIWSPISKQDVPLFWHIPKNGGTTVADILTHCLDLVSASNIGATEGRGNEPTLQVRMYADKGRYINVNTATPDGIERARELGLVSSGLADVIVTHRLHLGASLYDSKHFARVFAMFRHPVKRATSMFYYLQRAKWEPTYDHSLANLTLEQYAESGKAEENWVTRFLTHEYTGQLTEEHVVMAKEVMRRKVVVGLIDKFGDSLKRFELYFDWWQTKIKSDPESKMKCQQARALASQNHLHHPDPLGSSAAYVKLANLNWADLQLYNYAIELFDEQQALVNGKDPSLTNDYIRGDELRSY